MSRIHTRTHTSNQPYSSADDGHASRHGTLRQREKKLSVYWSQARRRHCRSQPDLCIQQHLLARYAYFDAAVLLPTIPKLSGFVRFCFELDLARTRAFLSQLPGVVGCGFFGRRIVRVFCRVEPVT